VRPNKTPRAVRATGARDAHGRILDDSGGALYVHLHREAGLAHRHYVLRPWQVRALALFTSRPMLALYFVAVISWGWMAAQAARVPLLQSEISRLTHDAQRLDTLSATLTQLKARYDQVQRMLSAASERQATAALDTLRRGLDSTRTPAGVGGR
jgi:Tfp pilus assembly protein PilN